MTGLEIIAAIAEALKEHDGNILRGSDARCQAHNFDNQNVFIRRVRQLIGAEGKR